MLPMRARQMLMQRLRWVLVTLVVMAAGEFLAFIGYCFHLDREERAAGRVAAAATVASKLGNVERLLSAFAATGDPWCLERARSIADDVYAPDPGIDARGQHRRRQSHLDLLLRIWILIDGARDPLWSPRCWRADRVRDSDRGNPVALADPERQRAEHDAGDGRLQAQYDLSVAENHCMSSVASLVKDEYHEDQAELTEAIERILPEHERARRFLTLVPR